MASLLCCKEDDGFFKTFLAVWYGVGAGTGPENVDCDGIDTRLLVLGVWLMLMLAVPRLAVSDVVWLAAS